MGPQKIKQTQLINNKTLVWCHPTYNNNKPQYKSSMWAKSRLLRSFQQSLQPSKPQAQNFSLVSGSVIYLKYLGTKSFPGFSARNLRAARCFSSRRCFSSAANSNYPFSRARWSGLSLLSDLGSKGFRSSGKLLRIKVKLVYLYCQSAFSGAGFATQISLVFPFFSA